MKRFRKKIEKMLHEASNDSIADKYFKDYGSFTAACKASMEAFEEFGKDEKHFFTIQNLFTGKETDCFSYEWHMEDEVYRKVIHGYVHTGKHFGGKFMEIPSDKYTIKVMSREDFEKRFLPNHLSHKPMDIEQTVQYSNFIRNLYNND